MMPTALAVTDIGWSQPVQPRLDRWPAPLDDCAYDGILGDIVIAIAPHTEADPAALLMQSLVAFGNVVGHRPHCRADGAAHHTNLNAVLVGRTSKARKGTSWAQIRRPFESADETFAHRIESGLSSGEGLIFAVRDPVLKGDTVEDVGILDKRLLVTEGEFAHVVKNLSRDGNILSAVIREAWDSGRIGTLTKHARTKATDAHISIIGHITQDELRRYLDATEAGNGFGNRFLWVCVKRSQTLPYGGQLSAVDFAPLVHQLPQAIQRARQAGELAHDVSAREVWMRAYPDLSEGEPGMLGAMTSRAEAQVLRLAMLYALTDRSLMSYVVSASHLRSAQQRGTRHERGYDHAWVTLRARFLEESCPWFCALQGPTCTARDRQMDASEVDVDHIAPFRGLDDPRRLESANLRCCCRACHGARHGRGPRGGG